MYDKLHYFIVYDIILCCIRAGVDGVVYTCTLTVTVHTYVCMYVYIYVSVCPLVSIVGVEDIRYIQPRFAPVPLQPAGPPPELPQALTAFMKGAKAGMPACQASIVLFSNLFGVSEVWSFGVLPFFVRASGHAALTKVPNRVLHSDVSVTLMP